MCELDQRGLEVLVDSVLGELSSQDLRQCRLVSWTWLSLVSRVTTHREVGRLGWGWREGEPGLARLQCSRERSVCTVTSLAVDEEIVVAGLGSCGRVEVWDRRQNCRLWAVLAHTEGVYTVGLGGALLVTGGEDHTVRLWARKTGDLLLSLQHHTFIVWAVRISLDQLVTASYDCTVCFLSVEQAEVTGQVTCQLQQTVQGPWEWADALYLEEDGDKVVVQDEEVFVLTVWHVKTVKQISRLEGHTEEVNTVSMRGHLMVSGGSEGLVRLWDWRSGGCLAVLGGHKGKVWSVSLDRFRVVSGGRYGEVRVWPLQEREAGLARGEEGGSQCDTVKYGEGRVLYAHPRSSSVASLHLDRFGLVSGDGLALVIQWDFWSSQAQSCPCKHYTEPQPDPVEL